MNKYNIGDSVIVPVSYGFGSLKQIVHETLFYVVSIQAVKEKSQFGQSIQINYGLVQGDSWLELKLDTLEEDVYWRTEKEIAGKFLE